MGKAGRLPLGAPRFLPARPGALADGGQNFVAGPLSDPAEDFFSPAEAARGGGHPDGTPVVRDAGEVRDLLNRVWFAGFVALSAS